MLRSCVGKQQLKWCGWEDILHLCFVQGCFSWCWRAAGESSACPILGRELLAEHLGMRLHLAGLRWIFIPLKYVTSGDLGVVRACHAACRHLQFKWAFWLLLKDGNRVYLPVSGVLEDGQTRCVHLSSWACWGDQGWKVYSGPSPSHHAFMHVCAACECNCGLHIWYLGLVVKFSLTSSLSGKLLSLVCGVAAAVVARIQRLCSC